jgi:hypothetical protein
VAAQDSSYAGSLTGYLLDLFTVTFQQVQRVIVNERETCTRVYAHSNAYGRGAIK